MYDYSTKYCVFSEFLLLKKFRTVRAVKEVWLILLAWRCHLEAILWAWLQLQYLVSVFMSFHYCYRLLKKKKKKKKFKKAH